MGQTSREIVDRTLKFENPERVPRDMWSLPISAEAHPEVMDEIAERFPADLGGPPDVYQPSSRVKGSWYELGTFVDEWSCVFVNVQKGVHGEVKDPILKDLTDWETIEPPYEILPADPDKARDEVNRAYAESDKYIRMGGCARPWERYQFIRGSENALMDVMLDPDNFKKLLQKIQEFYIREMEFWVTTDVDALYFMDDWGSQNQLLIPPDLWRDYFKPLYKEYCDLAHSHGKSIFMHSDGHIQEVYPDLIEVGVDALNSQLFCMDMDYLEKVAKGKITIWGEIDRQHVLTAPDVETGREAVREVARHFYDPAGGVFAQFSFTAGANPDMPITLFEEWQRISEEGIPKG